MAQTATGSDDAARNAHTNWQTTGRQLAESHLVQPLQLGLHSHQSLGTRVNQTVLAGQRSGENCRVGLAAAQVAARHAPVERVKCGGGGCALGGEI